MTVVVRVARKLDEAAALPLPEAEALLQHNRKLDRFAQTLAENYIQDAHLGLIHPVNAAKVTALTRRLLAMDAHRIQTDKHCDTS